MTSFSIKNNLSDSFYRSAYFSVLAIVSAVFVTTGTLWGSVAGGLSFSLLHNMSKGLFPSSHNNNDWHSPIFSTFGVFLAMALFYYKWESMPTTWDPPSMGLHVGIISYIIATGVILVLIPEDKSDLSDRIEIEEVKPEPNQKGVPLPFIWRFFAIASLFSAMAFFVVVNIAASFPSVLSSPTIAAHSHISKIMSLSHKDNLDAYFYSRVNVTDWKIIPTNNGFNLTYKLEVPIIPQDITEKELNSGAYYRNLKNNIKFEMVSIQKTIPYVKHGLGFKSDHPDTVNLLDISKQYREGNLKATSIKVIPDIVTMAIGGVKSLGTLPVLISLMSLLVTAGLFLARQDKLGVIMAVVGSILSVYMVVSPILITILM